MAFLASAAIGGLGSLIGGGKQASAATDAANIQAQASEYAANLQYQTAQQANQLIQSIYNQNVTRLQPFVGAGYQGTQALENFAGGLASSPLTQPFEPTMAQLAQTPGYQFALQQGELATASPYVSQGLGAVVGPNGAASSSGPLGKALANYAEGLAGTTYQQQFQNYLTQNQQIYSMLSGTYGGLATLGENAAAQTGAAGTAASGQSASALTAGAQGYGQYSTGAAAAQAAGTVGSASALSGGLSGATSSLSNALLYSALFGGQGGLTPQTGT